MSFSVQPAPVSLGLMDLSTIKSSSKLRQGFESRLKAEIAAEQARLNELEAQHDHQRSLHRSSAMMGGSGGGSGKHDAQQQPPSPQRARGLSSPQRARGFPTQPKVLEPAEALEDASQMRAAAEAHALQLREEARAVAQKAARLDGDQVAAHAASKLLNFRPGRRASKL